MLPCPICQSEYNNDTNIPIILTLCGHTICVNCAVHIIKTTTDGKFKCPFDKYLVFLLIFTLLEKNSPTLSSMLILSPRTTNSSKPWKNVNLYKSFLRPSRRRSSILRKKRKIWTRSSQILRTRQQLPLQKF